MLKININYDMIDKIYEAKGEHKLRLIYKNSPATAFLAASFASIEVMKAIQGIDVLKSLSFAGLELSFFLIGVPLIHINGRQLLLSSKYNMEEAINKIKDLSNILNLQNLNTTPELLLQSEVYYKKYKLVKDGKSGVIRERYINIPFYNFNGDKTLKSVKEEHRIGSKEYILTLDSPKKQKVLKRVYTTS